MDDHLVFSKIFVIVSHNILTDALTKHRLDTWTQTDFLNRLWSAAWSPSGYK